MPLLPLLLLLISPLRSVYRENFPSNFYHERHFGWINSIHVLPNSGIIVSNDQGFAKIGSNGEVQYVINESIKSLAFSSESVFAVSSEEKAFVFSIESGILTKELKEKEKFAGVSFDSKTKSPLWITNRHIFSPGSKDEKIEFAEGEIISSKAINDKIEIQVKQEEGFCTYTVDWNAKTKTKSSCSKILQKKDEKEASNCISAKEDQNLEACFQNNHVLLNKEKKTLFKTDIAEEKPILLSFDKYSGAVFIFSDRATLFSIDLNTQKLNFKLEESIALISAVQIFHTLPLKDPHMVAYESHLKSYNLLAAWKDRMTHMIKAISQNFKNLNQIFHSTYENLKAERIAIVVTKVGKVFLFDFREMKFTKSILLPMKEILESDIEHSESSVTIKSKEKKIIISQDLKVSEEIQHDSKSAKLDEFECVINAAKNEITGKINNLIRWNYILPEDEKIIDSYFPSAETESDTAYLVEADRVVYKLNDPNNFLLLTKKEETVMAYVINARSGKILGHFSNNKILNTPIAIADDNGFIISYVQKDSLMTELWIIEIFRKEVETEISPIIKKAFKKSHERFPIPNYLDFDPPFIILQKKYSLAVPVLKLAALRSSQGITSRNILLLTANSDIISLPRNFVSTRRIDENEKQKIEKGGQYALHGATLIKSQSLPLYEYRLTVDPKASLTKDVIIDKIDRMVVEPSDFESTIHLLATGRDFFLTKTSPDKTFDQLPEDFDKKKLIIIMCVCVLAVIITDFLNKKKQPSNRFLETFS